VCALYRPVVTARTHWIFDSLVVFSGYSLLVAGVGGGGDMQKALRQRHLLLGRF
jgi:hypothetical protein